MDVTTTSALHPDSSSGKRLVLPNKTSGIHPFASHTDLLLPISSTCTATRPAECALIPQCTQALGMNFVSWSTTHSSGTSCPFRGQAQPDVCFASSTPRVFRERPRCVTSYSGFTAVECNDGSPGYPGLRQRLVPSQSMKGTSAECASHDVRKSACREDWFTPTSRDSLHVQTDILAGRAAEHFSSVHSRRNSGKQHVLVPVKSGARSVLTSIPRSSGLISSLLGVFEPVSIVAGVNEEHPPEDPALRTPFRDKRDESNGEQKPRGPSQIL